MKRIFSIALILCLAVSCLSSLTLGAGSCEHVYSQTLFEPTCVEDGFTMYLCRLCGDCYQDEFVPALGHDLEMYPIYNGGCSYNYYETCTRCEYIHDVSTDNHGYTYGACWFCDRQEPNAVYNPVEMPLDGDQVVLAYRGRALNTTFETVKVTMEEESVSCPPKEAVWTIHKREEGYVLRHKEEELRIGYNGELEMSSIQEGSLWSLVPTEEPGEYQFYCQEEDLYLSETSKGWYASNQQTFGEKLKIYAYCDHMLSEPAVAQPATCFSEGVLQRTCVICRACYDEPIPKEPHSYKDNVCIWCAKPAAEDHIWSDAVKTTEATCTQGSKEYRTCTQCGENTVTILSEPTEHQRILLYAREASCKEVSVDYYGCPCGQLVYETNPGSTVHTYGPWTEVQAGPCAYSVLERSCIHCGAEHSEGWFTPSHTFGPWQVETYPTCEEDGFFYRQCRECRETENKSIPFVGHLFVSEQIVKEPTCQESGENLLKCLYCEETELVAIPTIDHQWDQGVVTVEPTWLEKGELTFTCLLCGDTETQALDTIEKVPCDGGEDCWSHPFADVPPVEDWAHEGIDFAVAMGLFNGISEDTFAPNRTMTRAMLVTVLWRYAGSPAAGENTFVDVENGLWYTHAITWAAEKEIVTGVGNRRFNPDGDVTREQIATILYRFAEFMGDETEGTADLSTYPDGETVSSWAAEAMAWAVENELIKGILQKDEAYLTPKGPATRAQVATILMRYIENLPAV